MILDELLQDQNPWWRDGAIRRARDYPVRRDLQPKILERILRLDDRRATVLLGPRQVGKTVLLLQLADDLLEAGWPPPNLTYFDFSDDRITGEMTAREVVEARPAGLDPSHPRVFLLDEIRSAANWGRWLKQAVDARIGRIVATDSAASLLRDGGRESGQGRWDEIYMEGLSFREFVRLRAEAEGFVGEIEKALLGIPNVLQRYLDLGGFPEYALFENLGEGWRRLREDIARKAIERDLGRLGVDVQRVKDLFIYLVQASGAELNADSRASDLGADPRSVRDWVRLLCDTLLLVPQERWIRHPAAGLRSKPKIFASDPGLIAAFHPLPAENPKVRSAVFEAAVFRHLRERAREIEGEVFYFRQKDRGRDELEIDFVLTGRGRPLLGVEVTSSPLVRTEKVSRLNRAGREMGADRLTLVYGGLIEQTLEEVRVVPLRDFLLNPKASIEEARP